MSDYHVSAHVASHPDGGQALRVSVHNLKAPPTGDERLYSAVLRLPVNQDKLANLAASTESAMRADGVSTDWDDLKRHIIAAAERATSIDGREWAMNTAEPIQ
jgi:hypothetical protein